ncbi:hypothetical protein [Geodermatophilus sp. TF02-6]|uniref:hypothetical protein n=1 Tax=Geodermatophilus sp. TF02-6 TaxID=2250575 RepID=UPI0011BE666C|nr:hypothetical protein [Geodermatophilus sp. TF02-6]
MREAAIRAHPHRYAVRRTAPAVLGVLLPVLGLWLLSRIDIPLPHFSISLPDWNLPAIPWPDWDLPNIPLPDWDLPELPAWVRELLDKAKYVWPVLLAFVLARAEVRRWRTQDERKRRADDVWPDPDRAGDDDSPTGGPSASP